MNPNPEPRPFILNSPYAPAGDQPQAISQLIANFQKGSHAETLLGVTGSGKTFTVANLIADQNRPTLVLSHNKTLAAQLYQEFKTFFPDNEVHYFVSYYDYFQPEAYVPTTDTYIEKDAQINDFIDQLRHAATASLLTRRDTIVVASVSAIYGLADPKEYYGMAKKYASGQQITPTILARDLASLQYARNDIARPHGSFFQRGEIIEIVSPDGGSVTRFEFFGNTVERIRIRPNGLESTEGITVANVFLFPAKHFVTPEAKLALATRRIEEELDERLETLEKSGKILEAERLRQRTRMDLAMIRETGFCAGIENYSRHLALREAGESPHTLIDYFPKDFLTVIDESHMSLPQIRGMSAGDRARKQTLVDFGFRLPSALDNRPLRFEEFESRITDTLYVSATPSEYEKSKSSHIVEQLIRPTGLIDPTIEVRPTKGQVADAIEVAKEAKIDGDRTLVLALTQKNAEDIADFMGKSGISTTHLHAEIETLERPEILRKLREGIYDVLVGINLLREGLDLPEVSRICILDADKEGFLRNDTMFIQTIGRTARHLSGHVILYADRITGSMERAISETTRRRYVQDAYNKKHNIIPTAAVRAQHPALFPKKGNRSEELATRIRNAIASAPDHKSRAALKLELEAEMLEAAANLEFEKAASIRDQLRATPNN